MKPDKIRKIVGERLKKIKKLSKTINNDFEKDAIHEFRVAVKSLRSFLRLLRMAYDDQGPKIPGKFKRLYHIAGAIRDAQLELDNLTASNASLPVYTDKLKNDIKRQKTEWERQYSDKVFRKMKKRLMGYEYDTLSPDALAAFHHMKVTSMKKLGKVKPTTNAHVHGIRKNVKDIIYTTKLAQKEWQPAFNQTEHSVEELDLIATMIGDFNDERIQLEHLTSFFSPKSELEEVNSVKQICKEDTLRLRAGKKKILAVVNKFTSRA